MTIYRKKPVVIEAVQWTGLNTQEIYEFCNSGNRDCHIMGDKLLIKTLEGTMEASNGDYIIRGVKGELYPCKSDIFEMTYERVYD